MQSRDYFVRCKLRTNVRPLRIAYLFEENDAATLLHLLRLAVTDWGGIYNYMLPVQSDDTVALGLGDLAAIHPPDFVFSYLPTTNENPFSGAKRAAAIVGKQFGTRSDKVMHGPHFENRAGGMHPLSAMPRSVVDSPNTVRPSGFANKLTSYGFPEHGDDVMYLLAAFGEIPPEQRDEYETLCQINEQPMSLDHPDFWTNQRYSGPTSSPVNLSGCNLAPLKVRTNGYSSLPFYVVVASCPSTVCFYWNLRAIREAAQFDRIGRRTMLLPLQLARDATAVAAMLDAIREAPFMEGESCDIDFVLCYGSKEEREAIEATLNSIPNIVEPTGDSMVSHRWGGHKGRLPREADKSRLLKYRYCSPPLPASLLHGVPNPVEPTNVDLTFGENEVSFTPPASFENRFRQTAVIDLQSNLWERYSRSAEIAKSIQPGAWWTAYGLSFHIIVPTRATYLKLSLPSDWEALRLHFAALGYEVAQSQNGRYADAVVKLLGGLRDASVLTSPNAYQVLEKLTLPSSKKLAQRIKSLGMKLAGEDELMKALRDPQIIEELKNVCKSCRQLSDSLGIAEKTLLPLLNELSAAGVVRRGFFLPCPNCGTPSWHLLGEIREYLVCPGCSHEFHLPVERPEGSEIRWEYRLNTLVNRAMDQDSLPAILALYHVQKDRPIFGAVPGVELREKGKNDVAAEFDFVFIRESKLCAGECKSGHEIGEKDLRVAKFAVELGIAEYFFCTPQTFSNESQAAIAALAEELNGRMTVTPLDGKALLGT